MGNSNKILDQIMMNMVEIPEGSFLMGSMTGEPEERPIHNVIIDSFLLNKYEVTQGEWFEIMATSPWQELKYSKSDKYYPAVNISWYDIKQFLKKLGKLTSKTFRLPTEAEWEYACRAGTTSKHPYGFLKLNLAKHAWFYENAFKKGEMYPHQVGRKQANKWGLHDMLGNVYEWCSDWFSENYYNKSPISNPAGPRYGSYKIVRGGDWARTDYFLRVSSRRYYSPHFKDSYIGFRLVIASSNS